MNEIDQSDLITLIKDVKVVPLITLHSAEEAVPLARALAAGGVPLAEVTFRSPAALAGMKAIHSEVPEVTLVAGTVHTVDQAWQAIQAGCRGIVSPAFSDQVVDWCLGSHIPILPGTATPSDIEKAYDRGLRYTKFFPAEAYGGVRTLKALSGPFAEMQFLPTGGVGLKNVQEYMSLSNVFAVGGSFPVPSEAQERGDWDAVTNACMKARQLVAD